MGVADRKPSVTSSLSFEAVPQKLVPMQTSSFRHFAPFFLGILISSGNVFADQVVQTLPAGDGKAILDSPVNPDGGGAIIRDDECAKKTGGGKLKNGKANPDYERCVHEKIEKAKTKGSH